MQELKRKGGELSGPAAKLLKAGAEGRWTSNMERDMTRTLNGALHMVAQLHLAHHKPVYGWIPDSFGLWGV